MATIRTSCPNCGDVEFTTREIRVEISNPDGSGSYRFSCPGCTSIIVKSAETKVVDLLLTSGVEQLYPFTAGELEEFANALNNGSTFDDAFRSLVQEMQ